MQNVWGEENVPENALSRKILDPSKRASGLLCRGSLYRKNRALTPEGGGKRISVALPAEPRGEKKLFFVQILGGEKLLKFGEKWAVKNF